MTDTETLRNAACRLQTQSVCAGLVCAGRDTPKHRRTWLAAAFDAAGRMEWASRPKKDARPLRGDGANGGLLPAALHGSDGVGAAYAFGKTPRRKSQGFLKQGPIQPGAWVFFAARCNVFMAGNVRNRVALNQFLAQGL